MIGPNDISAYLRIRELARVYFAFSNPYALDAILEVCAECEAGCDPDYKRPAVLGEKPSAKAESMLGLACGEEWE